MMFLNQSSTIVNLADGFDVEPVRRAMETLRRDLGFVCRPADRAGGEIWLVRMDGLAPECYTVQERAGALEIGAGDARGFVYGVYAVSRELLGVRDFWFWNDQQFEPRDKIDVPEGFRLEGKPFAVRFRGWFVNDEVLIHAWSVDRRPERPWEMVFEALLRCGGNMVIPGTGQNAKKYRALAAEMGLILTHHHAEPLGAEMFARAYPELNASYAEHPDKFHQLWERALEEQSGCEVVWNLGFRGQGDRPFWDDDPQYATPEARGELMGALIRKQYELVQARFPGAVCATNLYGETMELYRDGHLHLPEEIIKIWADNGFGAMVSRRQGNHNPRIPALPTGGDHGAHGIYYHASFYDLQAANHITMLPNPPEFVANTLQTVLERNVKDYWIVNCSNVKPHVFTLGLIARIWRDGNVDAEDYLREYSAQYFGVPQAEAVAECFRAYYGAAVTYGPHQDDHAGEQFSNYVARMLVSQYMRDKNQREPGLLWATDAGTLRGQAEWYFKLCRQGAESYAKALNICEKNVLAMPEVPQRLTRDFVLLQIQIYAHCYRGAALICQSLLEALDNAYQRAFYHAGLAREEYLAANAALRNREHGKWNGFYANECLTDMKQTAWLLGHYMGYLRNLGDGPHFYLWQREFLYPPEDAKVVLITNMENHLTDGELFALMKEKWQK